MLLVYVLKWHSSILSVCDYSLLVTLYEIGGVSFTCLEQTIFIDRHRMKYFLLWASVVIKTLNLQI